MRRPQIPWDSNDDKPLSRGEANSTYAKKSEVLLKTSSISELSDVDASAPTDKQILTFDQVSGKWKSEDPAAGGKTYQAGTGIAIDNPTSASPTIRSTVGAIGVDTRVATYSALPASPADGYAVLVDGPPALIYIYSATLGWPAEGDGLTPGGGGGVSVPDYKSTIIADSPLAFWPLDDASGTTAADASGNAYDGTFSGGFGLGLTPSINLPGCSLFGGVDGCVTIPYATWMDLTEYSLEAWVWLLRSTTERVGFITRSYPGPGSGSIPYELGLSINGAGAGAGVWQYSGSSWDNGMSQSNPLALMEWAHIVGTVSSTGAVNCYINGMKAATETTWPTLVDATTEDLILGRQHNIPGNNTIFHSGALSCCAIYDHVLTPAQISEHWRVGSIPKWLAA